MIGPFRLDRGLDGSKCIAGLLVRHICWYIGLLPSLGMGLGGFIRLLFRPCCIRLDKRWFFIRVRFI